ncbi:flagellar export chaperone FlgN [Paraglaciecola hydrolytica]|uniref:Flagellar biosynthesis protein FlgN n=1 Tax=Paraglaciecola hydrolytica TaxID=1799789 RepID=A0A148KNM2_9ALTE|nr:flagellar export chaperone FlgN [Paraglaciecola hydrolytica]KXI27881.1 flagellar biosynthesis protein FlgN [Paraglaciecola hydrolytica]
MIIIIKAIKQQISQLEQLQQVLETELHLISTRDPETLLNLLKSKEVLLDLIQTKDDLIAQRYETLSETDKQNTELNELFDYAKKQVEQCQYRTSINQTAVEQGQLRLEHLRNLILESRAKESMTYDKSGRTKGGRSGKGVNA